MIQRFVRSAFALVSLVLTLDVAVAAQEPSARKLAIRDQGRAWVTTYGGADVDFPTGVEQAGRRGFFASAVTYSFGAGSSDAWILRLDSGGRVVWNAVLGGAGRDEIYDIVSTPDGGCAVVGFTESFGAGGSDGWVIKLDAGGDVQWQRTYGSTGAEVFRTIALSPDGFYVGGTLEVAGAGVDAWILELDPSGDVLWQQSLGGSRDDHVTSIASTPDGLVFSAASASELVKNEPPIAFFRPWLVRLDGDGNSLWQKTYSVSNGDAWTDIIALAGGGFAVTGEVLAMAFFRGDAWVVRLDDAGNVLWDRRFGDHFGNLDVDSGAQIRETPDGSLRVLGSTATGGAGAEDFWLLAFDAEGVLQWQRTLGDVSFENGAALALARDGGMLALGFTPALGAGLRDLFAFKLSPDGATGPRCNFSGPTHPNQWIGPLTIFEPSVAPMPTSSVPANSTALVATPAVKASYVCAPLAR